VARGEFESKTVVKSIKKMALHLTEEEESTNL
jgi:hypothetical protein